MNDGRVIRLSWDEWRAGRAAKRAALAAHGLSGESRRTSARPDARRLLAQFQAVAARADCGNSKTRIGELAPRSEISPHPLDGEAPRSVE